MLSRLSALWNTLSSEGKLASVYGFSRKFYPIYLKKLVSDQAHLNEYFDISGAEVDPGTPDSAVIDSVSGSLYFTGRVTLPLEPDVVARVFLKYRLDGKEYWWAHIRGPRGKMFDPLFREYFDEETTKEVR